MMYGDDAHTVETESGVYGPDHVFHVHNGYHSGWESRS